MQTNSRLRDCKSPTKRCGGVVRRLLGYLDAVRIEPMRLYSGKEVRIYTLVGHVAKYVQALY